MFRRISFVIAALLMLPVLAACNGQNTSKGNTQQNTSDSFGGGSGGSGGY